MLQRVEMFHVAGYPVGRVEVTRMGHRHRWQRRLSSRRNATRWTAAAASVGSGQPWAGPSSANCTGRRCHGSAAAARSLLFRGRGRGRQRGMGRRGRWNDWQYCTAGGSGGGCFCVGHCRGYGCSASAQKLQLRKVCIVGQSFFCFAVDDRVVIESCPARPTWLCERTGKIFISNPCGFGHMMARNYAREKNPQFVAAGPLIELNEEIFADLSR